MNIRSPGYLSFMLECELFETPCLMYSNNVLKNLYATMSTSASVNRTDDDELISAKLIHSELLCRNNHETTRFNHVDPGFLTLVRPMEDKNLRPVLLRLDWLEYLHRHL